ncbi:MAG: flavodoxin domain-containing protein [Nitrososphaerales archaeon]
MRRRKGGHIPASILVGYAARYGSTEEVAEAIAATLRECDLAVTCQPMKDVRDFEGYSGIVLGAPLYMVSWHKDALRFLSRHRHALMQRPVTCVTGRLFARGRVAWPKNSGSSADRRALCSATCGSYSPIPSLPSS